MITKTNKRVKLATQRKAKLTKYAIKPTIKKVVNQTPSHLHKDQSHSEAELQKEIVKLLSAYKDLFIIYNDPVAPAMKYISNPNMRMAFVQYSKNRGWEKGSTDLVIVWRGKVTFLELKFNGKTKGKLSEEQIAYRERVEAAGYDWQCWRSMDECIEWLNKRLNE